MAAATEPKAKQAAPPAAPQNGKPAEHEETKAEKFRRLANFRVPKVVITIRNIGNLSNRATYEYTDEQVAKIIGVLRDEVTAIENRFANKSPSKKIDLF